MRKIRARFVHFECLQYTRFYLPSFHPLLVIKVWGMATTVIGMGDEVVYFPEMGRGDYLSLKTSKLILCS